MIIIFFNRDLATQHYHVHDEVFLEQVKLLRDLQGASRLLPDAFDLGSIVENTEIDNPAKLYCIGYMEEDKETLAYIAENTQLLFVPGGLILKTGELCPKVLRRLELAYNITGFWKDTSDKMIVFDGARAHTTPNGLVVEADSMHTLWEDQADMEIPHMQLPDEENGSLAYDTCGNVVDMYLTCQTLDVDPKNAAWLTNDNFAVRPWDLLRRIFGTEHAPYVIMGRYPQPMDNELFAGYKEKEMSSLGIGFRDTFPGVDLRPDGDAYSFIYSLAYNHPFYKEHVPEIHGDHRPDKRIRAILDEFSP